jgi:hypothetical protein
MGKKEKNIMVNNNRKEGLGFKKSKSKAEKKAKSLQKEQLVDGN